MNAIGFFKNCWGLIKKGAGFVYHHDTLGLIGNLGAELLSELIETPVSKAWDKHKSYRLAIKSLDAVQERLSQKGENFLSDLYDYLSISAENGGKRERKKSKQDLNTYLLTLMDPITEENLKAFEKYELLTDEEKKSLLKALQIFQGTYCQILLEKLDTKEQMLVQVLLQGFKNILASQNLNKDDAQQKVNAFLFGKEKLRPCPHCNTPIQNVKNINPETGFTNCYNCGENFFAYEYTDEFRALKASLQKDFEKSHQDFIQLESNLKTYFDAKSQDLYKNNEETREALQRISKQLGGNQQSVEDLLNSVETDISKELKAASNKIIDAVKGNREVLEEMLRRLLKETSTQLKNLADDSKELKAGQQHIAARQDEQLSLMHQLLESLQQDASDSSDACEHTCPVCSKQRTFRYKDKLQRWLCPACGYKIQSLDVSIPTRPIQTAELGYDEGSKYLSLTLDTNTDILRVRLPQNFNEIADKLNVFFVDGTARGATLVLVSDNPCTLPSRIIKKLTSAQIGLHKIVLGCNVEYNDSIPNGWKKEKDKFIKQENKK